MLSCERSVYSKRFCPLLSLQITDRDSGKYTFSISLYMLELYQVRACCLRVVCVCVWCVCVRVCVRACDSVGECTCVQ
jgi:hypothetical protein